MSCFLDDRGSGRFEMSHLSLSITNVGSYGRTDCYVCLNATLCPFVSSVSEVADMSLAQRVLLTWVFTLVFLITLVLKLDGKVGVCVLVCFVVCFFK